MGTICADVRACVALMYDQEWAKVCVCANVNGTKHPIMFIIIPPNMKRTLELNRTQRIDFSHFFLLSLSLSLVALLILFRWVPNSTVILHPLTPWGYCFTFACIVLHLFIGIPFFRFYYGRLTTLYATKTKWQYFRFTYR